MTSVLPTEKSDLLPRAFGKDTRVKYTLNIEIFRVIASISLILLFATGKVISTLFVFSPADGNGDPIDPNSDFLLRLFNSSGGTQDPRETVIYKIFGFNHICNIIDFNPAREVAGIMCPFFSLPMVTFCVLSYMRDLEAYKNKEITKGLLTYSKIATPLCIVFFSLIHMWFVNTPQGDYGFIAHYIPYMMFQWGIGLVAIHQAHYLVQVNKIPFGLPKSAAYCYAWFMALFTPMCQMLVISILAGHPILDSVNNLKHRAIFLLIGKIYAFTALIVPLIFASANLQTDDTNTIVIS